jgi:2-hydroxycyclohexanecarboxyl-CoA dehydrogenase
MLDACSLAGKVAVVTGGAGGIGGGITRLLAAAGALVVANDSDEESLAKLSAEVGGPAGGGDGGAGGAGGAGGGGRGGVVGVAGDIREQRTVDEVRTVALSAGGRIDVLVNNVGDYRPSSRGFARSTEDQWRELYAVNLEHVFRCTHRILPTMLEAGSGSIVNVSTVEAYRGIPSNAVYSAFKAGVVAFTRSLAVEVAGRGVRVNAIAPDMADSLQTPAASMLRGRDPGLVRSWIPLGRFGQPDDYAQVVLFLAGDGARYVTGCTIPVDGGTLAAAGWYGRADGRGWTNLPDRP